MKILITLAIVIYSFFCTGLARAQTTQCPSSKAKVAEESIDQIETWAQAIQFLQENRGCLNSGGVSYGYSDRLAELLSKPGGVKSMWSETEKHTWFRAVVNKRMQSEAISMDTSNAILGNLKSQCPSDAQKFCRNLRVKIKQYCTACTDEK